MTGWQGDEAPRADTGPIWATATGTGATGRGTTGTDGSEAGAGTSTTAAIPRSREAGASGEAQPPPPVRRQGRPWGWIALTTLLVLALAGASALAAYLWQTTTAWQDETVRVESVAADLRAERDELAAELDQSARDLAATDQQLREAQDRITELAQEKAQTADEREIARLLVTSVAGVATQLETCVRGQDQLITALSDLEAYDPESVVQYAESVRAACTQALRGNEEVQRIVGTE
jgi:septal ring factor EnvC (AmiA/AmiB activator)